MSQSVESPTKKGALSKLTVRQRPGTEHTLMSGSNTQVFLDGVLIKGATFLKFEVKAAKTAKVTIEMVASIDIDVNVDLEEKPPKDSGLAIDGKPISIYQLGSPFAAAIATKVKGS